MSVCERERQQQHKRTIYSQTYRWYVTRQQMVGRYSTAQQMNRAETIQDEEQHSLARRRTTPVAGSSNSSVTREVSTSKERNLQIMSIYAWTISS